jgi:uncharacterized protein YbjT (DUF2867 family)
MKPRFIDPKSPGAPSPACDVVTGRRDQRLVDCGPLSEQADAAIRAGRELHVILAEGKLEELGALIGMVPKDDYDEAVARAAAAEDESVRKGAILAGIEEMSAAEDKLREALGMSHQDPGDGTDKQEQQ